MQSKHRIIVDFSLSLLERSEAAKHIKSYKEASFKPYRYIFLIKKASVYSFIFAIMFTILQMIMIILKAPDDGSFMARAKVISCILLALFGVSLALSIIYDAVLNRVMKKNQASEQADEELSQRVKLTRYYVENITPSVTGRVYWEHIKSSYRNTGFIYIHMLNDSCVVIPERVFASEDEVASAAEFILTQMAQRKQLVG
ncbi:YcxB family protein [Yersinia rohdei]|nr:YcxB family protein [Yersinia rohdei]